MPSTVKIAFLLLLVALVNLAQAAKFSEVPRK